jgi:hypothetical protein
MRDKVHGKLANGHDSRVGVKSETETREELDEVTSRTTKGRYTKLWA